MNELYHYGVIGMKWGVRRYQNPDGTLTAKGQKRYSGKITKRKEKHLTRQVEDYVNSRSDIRDRMKKSVATSFAKASKTEEGKRLKAANDFLLNAEKEAQKKGGHLVLNQEQYDQYSFLEKQWKKKAEEYLAPYQDSIAKEVLLGMGYEYTDAGRDYVKKIMSGE